MVWYIVFSIFTYGPLPTIQDTVIIVEKTWTSELKADCAKKLKVYPFADLEKGQQRVSYCVQL